MTPMIVEHPLLQHKISLLRNKHPVPRADGIHRWTGLSELGDLTKVAKNPYIVRIGRFLIFFTPDTFAGSPVVLTLRPAEFRPGVMNVP